MAEEKPDPQDQTQTPAAPATEESPAAPATEESPAAESVQVEEQKPESWIEKHRQELESWYDERESKRQTKAEAGPARPGKEDSGNDETAPAAPAPKRKRGIRVRSFNKRSA